MGQASSGIRRTNPVDVLILAPEIVRASIDDLGAVALTLMFEAGSEPVEGRIAVGNVIRNRVRHPKKFSATFRGVCVQRSQFSAWWQFGGKENYERLMFAASALLAGEPPPFNAIEKVTFMECEFLAGGILGARLLDNTRGAVNYYAPAAMVPKGRVPDEAKGRPSLRIGSQIFYSAA